MVGAVSVDKGMRIVGKYVLDYFNTEYGRVGEAYKTIYNNADCIEINYKGITKRIVFAGGYNRNSQDFIQGDSYSGVYLTEINLLNKDFISQSLKRTAAAKDGFLIGTLNPKGVNHWFYKEFLEIWANEQRDLPNKLWLNFNKFTMFDNPIMTPEMIEDAMRGYDKESILYKRDILGLRVDANGLIYKIFPHTIIEDLDLSKYSQYICVADFGETISATYFGCFALFKNKTQWELHLVKEFHHINKANDTNFKYMENYAEDFTKFISDSINSFNGKFPSAVLYDGTTEMFYRLTTSLRNHHLGNITPKFVVKDDINDRIQMGQNALYLGKFKFYKECQHLHNDISIATYDEKKYDTTGKFDRLKDYTLEGHLDAIDSMEYALTWEKKILNL